MFSFVFSGSVAPGIRVKPCRGFRRLCKVVGMAACFYMGFAGRGYAAGPVREDSPGIGISDSFYEYTIPPYDSNELALKGNRLNGYTISNDDRLYFAAISKKMHGKTDSCIYLLTKYIERNPKTAAAHYQLGICYMANQKLYAAINEARQAMELAPKNKWYSSLYADLKAYDGKYSEAGNVYGKLAKMVPDDAGENYMKQAELYRQARQFKKALKVINDHPDALETQDADDVSLLKQKLYLHLNEFDKAVNEAQKLADDNPYTPQYFLNLSSLYKYNNHPDEATAVLLKTDSIFPENNQVQQALLANMVENKDTNRLTDYLQQHFPDTYSITGDGNIINGLLEASTQKGIDSANISFLNAVSTQLLLRNSNNATANILRADIAILTGKNDTAIAYFKKAAAIEPKNEMILSAVMDYYASTGNMDSLARFASQGIQQFPHKGYYYFFKAITYQSRQQYPNVIETLCAGLQADTSAQTTVTAEMWSMLGDAYYFQKRYRESDSAYNMSLNIDSNNASTLNNYAYYLSERGVELEKAEKMSAKSLKLKPGEASFLDTYGWILYKLKQYDKAKDYISQALNASRGGTDSSSDASLFEHLGDIEYRLGHIEDAVKNWKKAQTLGLSSEILNKKVNDEKLYEH